LWEAIRLISALAGSVIGCEPEAHDRIIAHASHAVHLASSALASYTPPALSAQVAALHGGGLRDATRAAASDPLLWRDIISHNVVATTEALDDLIACLLNIRATVVNSDWDRLEAGLAVARVHKREMEVSRWQARQWEERIWPLEDLSANVLASGTLGLAVRANGVINDGFLPVLIRPLP
jgi:prephenate dehydrogenase